MLTHNLKPTIKGQTKLLQKVKNYNSFRHFNNSIKFLK